MEFTKQQIIEIAKQLDIDVNTNISDEYFITSVGNTTYSVRYNEDPLGTIKNIILNKGKHQLKTDVKTLFQI